VLTPISALRVASESFFAMVQPFGK
jgi:hypothetical protein